MPTDVEQLVYNNEQQKRKKNIACLLEDVQKWYFNLCNHLTQCDCVILDSDQFRPATVHNQFHPSSQYKGFLPASFLQAMFYSKFFDKN